LRQNMQWQKEDATDQEIYEALEIAQALPFVQEFKEGLDTLIYQGGKNLSGGQRQRLTIARALVSKPSILILDDSASALDFATDASLRKAIYTHLKHTTVFLVSQRVNTIKNADKIIVLDEGKMMGVGSHQELLKHCDIYEQICRSQLSSKELDYE
ncbi:MAG: ABC transporter ATP-binding protein, partial [Erysipelotrichaceae bacterium]|nr:ABC transporter ATP-binding protein [Erysipelotrichaceae bacterium]